MRRETVRAYWWNESPNFGDALTPILLDRLFGVHTEWASLVDAEVTACGSVMQWITPVVPVRREPLHVWGSGYIFAEEPAPPAGSVVCSAVRGAESARMSGLSTTVALGDPGLLVSRVVDAPRVPRHAVGVVPHLWHRSNRTVRDVIARSGAQFIDVAADPHEVVAAIAACEFVISSSLHGLVIADSFGIPNAWFTVEPELVGREWKFRDYYSAFGITPCPTPLTDGTNVAGVAERVRSQYSRPGLATIQDGLVSAWPLR